MAEDVLTLTCPAKINLALSVAPPDGNGMHPIVSWMVALAFGDTLTLERIAAHKQSDQLDQLDQLDQPSTFNLSYASDAPVPGVIDWPLEKDLAYRAHQLLQQHAKRSLPTLVTLNKRIPTGAGLGGGSSDAAAMLAGVNQLFKLDIDAKKLCELSQSLGSDVTYLTAAVLGQTSALVTGLGEGITPCPMNNPLHVVLIFPGVACPTGPVYKAFDKALAQHQATCSFADEITKIKSLMRLTSAAELCEQLFNDLASPACDVQPILRDLQQQAIRQVGRPIHITGSGATLFTLADSQGHAQQLASQLSTSLNLPAVATHTI